MQGILDAV